MPTKIDTTKELTINLVTEGYGVIVSFTSDKDTAYAGDTINLSMTIRNDGDTDDIFARITDADTGETVMEDVVWLVTAGETVDYSIPVTMPNKNWNLKLIAGHVEEEAPPLDISVTSVNIPDSVDYWESFNVECTVTNNGDNALVYIRLVDNDNNYIVNQTNILINSGQSETITFSDIYMACDNKNITIECGVLE